MNEFRLKGKIRYGNSWAWVECPKDVGDYYRAVAKWLMGVTLSPPLNGPHITLVAGKYEVAKHPELWGTLEGQEIEFEYGPVMWVDDYWWLTILEDSELQKFRTDLGLPPKLKYDFHLTIGRNADMPKKKYLTPMTNFA